MMHWQSKLAAEAFGTFALVFAGTGAIIANETSGGAVTHVGIALTFGLIVMAMICALGDVSGCHINPAVTIALFVACRFRGRWVIPYIVCQCVGATLASLVLRIMFATSKTLGATMPNSGVFQSFVMEFLISLILMFVIFSVSGESSEKRIRAGVAIGAVVALAALFAGPISGASMNPARSLAPALISMQFNSLFIYIFAPVLGACASIPVYRFIRDSDCDN